VAEDAKGPSDPTQAQPTASALKERLAEEMRAALKSGEKIRLGALRLLSASVKNREVELRHPLTDEEFLEVANGEVKRRKEAIEAFSAGGRDDLVAKESEEQRVLESYLPASLSSDEVTALIDEAITATDAAGPGDLGKVMGYVMGKAKGRVDGKEIHAKVRARLGG
jgi:uncharacterized protein YqeY